MKKLIFIVTFIVLMCSCSSGSEKAARNFSECMAKGKIEEAKTYATEPTAKVLDLILTFAPKEVNPDFNFELVSDSIVGNRAWVTFVDTSTEDEQTLELVKIDGEWKVNIDRK